MSNLRWSAPLAAALACMLSSLQGCATLMNGPTQAINIRSNPPGAVCDVGSQTITVPGVVVLKRGKGRQEIFCRLTGYRDERRSLRSELRPAYVVGNVFFGLLPGLVIDGITAAAEDYMPRSFDIVFEKLPAPATTPPPAVRDGPAVP